MYKIRDRVEDVILLLGIYFRASLLPLGYFEMSTSITWELYVNRFVIGFNLSLYIIKFILPFPINTNFFV